MGGTRYVSMLTSVWNGSSESRPNKMVTKQRAAIVHGVRIARYQITPHVNRTSHARVGDIN